MPKEDIKETHLLWFALVNSASLEIFLDLTLCYSVRIDTESFNAAPFQRLY